MRRFGRLSALTAAALVLTVAAVAVVLLHRHWAGRVQPPAGGLSPSPSPSSVFLSTVKVTTDGPRIAVGRLYASPERMGTWWEFTVICKQVEGCHDELEFQIEYREGGHAGRVTHRRVVDLPSLGQMKIRFMERQQHAVDAVDSVTVHSLRKTTTEPGQRGPAATPRPRTIRD